MNKAFPTELNDIPLSWFMTAREKEIQEGKIPCIFRVFRDRMIKEEKESEDWDKEWYLYVFSRAL